MDIITQRIKTKMECTYKRIGSQILIAGTVGLIASPVVADVNLITKAESNLIYQQLDSSARGDQDIFTLQLKPSVGAFYESESLELNLQGSVTHLERNSDFFDSSQTYGEYQMGASWTAIENLLTFSGSGATRYRNSDPNNYLVSDYLNNDGNLAKIQNNRAGVRLNYLEGNWFNTTANLSYTSVESDRVRTGTVSESALDSNNLFARARIFNGDNAKRFLWNIKGNYRKTERETGLNDFTSRTGDVYLDSLLFSNVGIRLTAYHDENEVADESETFTDKDEFTSYGAGLVYRQSKSRYIAVTLNESESDNPEIDGEQFVGLDMRWAFSPRTSFNAEVGKNAYGSRADVNFDYRTKRSSARLSYFDRITSTSRLLTETDPTGFYVCPIGVDNINTCDLLADLDYVPGEGLQAIPVFEDNISLEEEIILREALTATIGYVKSKLNLLVSIQVAEDERLTQQFKRDTASVNVSATYRLNSTLNFVSSVGFAQIEQSSLRLPSGESDNFSLTSGFNKKLSPRLYTDLTLTYLNRDGSFSTGVYGAEYTDIRLSAGVKYYFD
ncbi:hypothetical protein [Alteromonas sp. ASW11-130]|uniref:hypothetical protein n=1 Tax=Alteromonas sp. ASW11-130 TaxID=3015775 RepID=UPI0022419F3A|nr:hypothetical protein [Alteromonas sp. ASW11-130]MCW8091263.1 hypothetical protein [Alteromonas sp. ASW11-130]